MARIFISYAREDQPVARRIVDGLAREGLEAWWDHQIPPGRTWDEVIGERVSRAAVMIVIWSKHSVDSNFVKEEAQLGYEARKLVPVRVDDVEPPMGFRRTHAANLIGWRGETDNRQWRALLDEVRERLGAAGVAAPDPAHAQRQAPPPPYRPYQAPDQRTEPKRGGNGALIAFGLLALVVLAGGVVGYTQWQAGQARAAAEATQRAEQERLRREAEEARLRLEQERIAREAAEGRARQLETAEQQRQAQEQTAQAERERIAREAAARQADDNAWAAAQRTNTVSAYDTYLRTYPTGRNRAAAQTARTRLVAAQNAAPYDLAQLHADVRRAAEAGRAAQARAIPAASRARAAAASAEDAARRARAGEAGYRVNTETDGSRYEGGWTTVNHGFGTRLSSPTGNHVGDRYAGQYTNGARTGFGVYNFAINTNNPAGAGAVLRYEGEISGGHFIGVGVHIMRNGDRYSGEFSASLRSGSGVYEFADGTRYEGQYLNHRRHGHGVLWSAQGRVLQAGVWSNGSLTQPLAR